jgi:4'-phosphopantetheinyl transferase
MKQLAVQTWPGATPTPRDGLFAILIRTDGGGGSGTVSGSSSGSGTGVGRAAPTASPQRDTARRLIRQATREALAALLGLPLASVCIASHTGQPPAILLAGGPSTIALSFAYDGHYALAAVNQHGAIGADLMHVQDIPDWQAVAADYLGPAVCAALAATPPAMRASAFTSAWTQREAALKCHGLQLSEWQAGLPGQSIALALPVAGLLGHIHIGDNTA